jgi:hypothetical protein
LAEINRITHGDKNVYIDTGRMVFKCKIPQFTHDSYGLPIVIMLDCAKKQEIVLTQEEWLRRKTAGEL